MSEPNVEDVEVSKVAPKTTRGMSLKKRVGYGAAVITGVAAGFLGIDREARPVSAADSTPTQTPTAAVTGTATPTPDPFAARETSVANLMTQSADLDKRETATAQAVNREATVTAKEAKFIDQINARIAVLSGTVTATPTWTAEQWEIKKKAGLVTPTATLPPVMPTSRPTLTPTPVSDVNYWKARAEYAQGVSVFGALSTVFTGICFAALAFKDKIGTLFRRIRRRPRPGP